MHPTASLTQQPINGHLRDPERSGRWQISAHFSQQSLIVDNVATLAWSLHPLRLSAELLVRSPVREVGEALSSLLKEARSNEPG